MSLTALDLERKLDISLDILVNTYPREVGAVNISSHMKSYIRALVIDINITLV